jgi:hypothetical protein
MSKVGPTYWSGVTEALPPKHSSQSFVHAKTADRSRMTLVLFRTRRRDECLELKEGYGASRSKKPSEGSRWRLRWTRGYLWNFNRFSPGKPCQKRNSAKG